MAINRDYVRQPLRWRGRNTNAARWPNSPG